MVHFSKYDLDSNNSEFLSDLIEINDDDDVIDKAIAEIVYTEGNCIIDPYKMVIDSGCPKTVCGKPWIDAYVESKGSNFFVKRSNENEWFKFGPSQKYRSSQNYEIEVIIGNFVDKIKVSVVNADIPLLLGLDYQKKWEMIIDIGKSEIIFGKSGETFRVNSSKSSHWTLPLQPKKLHLEAKILVFSVETNNLSDRDLRKHVVKVHKNLCHKSENQMLLLYKMAKKDSKQMRKIINDVVSSCQICRKFKKTPPRPRVAMPKATTTNQVVSLDLKEKRKFRKHILYSIDEFSGYMVAEVINNKLPETIIKSFNKKWVREGPGMPEKGIFSDNGGEFKNPIMKEVAAKHGITLNLTAGNSPWSNGKNERNH